MRQLQEENDELYQLLKATETGKLKDEVRGLRRAVAKLEGALKGMSCVLATFTFHVPYAQYYPISPTESHQVISSLSCVTCRYQLYEIER